MSITPAGITFNLRTPDHIQKCHLTGSWDKYNKRYSMRQEKPGWWAITINFGSSMPPARYWYYYILDGYFESHDPNKPTCQEPQRKITLNILDYASSRGSSPSSAASSSASGISRFPSPTSTHATTPSSASSKRSGGIYSKHSRSGSNSSSGSSHRHSTYVSSSRRERSPPYYHDKAQPAVPGERRNPSPRRLNMELAHIVHPKPRNPLNNHKLTLDTAGARPYSMMTTAATTAGDSPVSAGSSRSNTSMESGGSYCSTCSGSTWSNSPSPTTPMCTCSAHGLEHRRECQYDSDESCFSGSGDEYSDDDYENEEVYRVSRGVAAERRKTYHHPSAQDDLAYRLERGLRV
ncbi:hypothetical protein EDC01DRAFT_261556 [Geopyxis carbonaria]|nr:hypothetical protein EDC01DRAFT_261556 [Geopyxis carbonaria]